MRDSRPNTDIRIKDKGWRLLLSEKEQNGRWIKHFSKVLNQPTSEKLVELEDILSMHWFELSISANVFCGLLQIHN